MAKVTQSQIDFEFENAIIQYFENGKTTICIAELRNGFQIIGTSAVADKSQFDKAEGEKWALENAKQKMWELEVYRLSWDIYSNVYK